MKWVVVFISVFICAALMTCYVLSSESEARGNSMFEYICEDEYHNCIVYNRYTKVMYTVSDGSYNRGTFTVLVNSDGSPMLWGVQYE